MRAPRFWWRRPGLAAGLLWPVAAIYGAVAGRRMARAGARAGLPVICVGNFVAGGAGKTPLAIEVARRLAGMGERPVFLTRGHGGGAVGPLLVDAARHSAREVGDEPLLLARHAPTVVSRSRPEGAGLAMRHGGVIVMDDGLQNPSLRKDLVLVAVDARLGAGNGLCLPAGPLRAPLPAQWRLADALVVVASDGADNAGRGAALSREAARRGLPVIGADIVPDALAAESLRGRRLVAFAGIGHPEKFFATLRGIGAMVILERAFADHHPYSAAELAALAALAAAENAILVTTEKDMARIGASWRGLGKARALPITLRIAEPAPLDDLLRGALAAARG